MRVCFSILRLPQPYCKPKCRRYILYYFPIASDALTPENKPIAEIAAIKPSTIVTFGTKYEASIPITSPIKGIKALFTPAIFNP